MKKLAIFFLLITSTLISVPFVYSTSDNRLSVGVFTDKMGDEDVEQILKKYHTDPNDVIIGLGPYTAHFMDFPNQRKMMSAASLNGLEKSIDIANNLVTKVDFIVYNNEHWDATPAEEKDDPVGAISKGADIIHTAGYGYGIAPDKKYLLGYYQQIDWEKIDVLIMQVQTLADKTEEFTDTVIAVSEVVRSANPNTEIFVQVALNLTDVSQIIKSIESVKNLVDGVIVIYLPDTKPPRPPCTNCTLENLDSILSGITLISRSEFSESAEIKIPDWVRNNAGWWSERKISDKDFASGIQYLIKIGVIKVPLTESDQANESITIPDWVRNNAGWWSERKISDMDFASGIQYLIKIGIILV